MRGSGVLLVCVLGLLATGALAPVAADPAPAFRVIVNPKNPVTRLGKRFVTDAFLKKRTRWEDDTTIQPVDLGPKSSVRARFSSDVLDRHLEAVRRYWAQLVFSGRGVPPPEMASDAEVIRYVAAHAGAIAYVSGSAELGGTKPVQVE